MNDMRDFLEALENTGGLLFEEGGKEGDKIDAAKKAALKEAGINYIWAYEPEGYDLTVLEHEKDGEKKGSWSVAFFTKAAGGKKLGTNIFKEDMLDEAEKADGGSVWKILDNPTGNFLDTVQLCIELASNKSMKGGFTSQKVQTAVSKAKSKK